MSQDYHYNVFSICLRSTFETSWCVTTAVRTKNCFPCKPWVMSCQLPARSADTPFVDESWCKHMNINEGVYIFVSETILHFNAADAASDSATHRLTTATSCSHQQRGTSARELCRVSIPRSPVLVIVTTQQDGGQWELRPRFHIRQRNNWCHREKSWPSSLLDLCVCLLCMYAMMKSAAELASGVRMWIILLWMFIRSFCQDKEKNPKYLAISRHKTLL